MATTAPYSWKSTDELAKKNQANTMAAAMRGQPAPAFGAPPASPAPAGAGQPSPLPAPAPSAGVSAFAVPKTMAEAMRTPLASQNLQAAQQNIAQGFAPLEAGPADSLARNQLQKTIDANTRTVAEQSTLAGRGQTGQRGGDLVNYFQQSVLPAKADLEANLQANRMKEEATRAQQAHGNLLGLESLASQQEESAANRASAEKMQDKSIASTEKVSFAQLSQQDKALAQEGSQFKDRLAFDTWATTMGIDEKRAERLWQANENQLERTARASESALSRELQKYLGDRGLDIDERKISEQIRQFDSKLDFDKWATQAGLDAQAAELVWKSNEADISRKWETGERMSTQDHQVNLTRLQAEIGKEQAAFSQLLGVKTMEKQAEIDKIAAATANEYQAARDRAMMGHDQAMEVLKSNLTAKLEQAGYDHETAMQAAEIQANAFQKEQDRKIESDMAKAELAYKYTSLQSEVGLSQQEIQLKRDGMNQELNLGLKQLGLDEKKINAAISSQEFQDRSGVISTFIEMAGDNPAAIDKAVAAFVDLLSDPKLPGGALVAAGDKQKMIDAVTKGAPVDRGKGPFAKSAEIIGDVGSGIANGAKAVGGGVADAAGATKRFFSGLF